MYAIYCPNLKGRYQPLDLVNNCTTNRRVYASTFPTKEQALKAAEQLQEFNPNIPFQVRKF